MKSKKPFIAGECKCRNCCQTEADLRHARHERMERLTGRGKFATWRRKPKPKYKWRKFDKLHGWSSLKVANRPKRRLNRRLKLKKIGTYRWKNSVWRARQAFKEIKIERQRSE